jgi:NAD(P)-dependent dehydrogenase (short-subunit alcohol dehydrogenase family)
MERFEGRRVLVTGGSSGIGAALVRAFAAAGARVRSSGRDAARLEQVREATGAPERVDVAVADLTDPNAARRVVHDAIEAMDGLDVLVNNAGVAFSAPVLELPWQQWRQTMSVNLDAPFLASQVAGRHMAANGGGSIVNVASTDSFSAEAPQADYNTSKAGLVMLTRSFALELGHLGVRVNAVAPGETLTAMVAEEVQREDFRDHYLRKIPMRRFGEPDEIAAVVLFLASDAASYVTGETILVDGGSSTGSWYDPVDEPPAVPGDPPAGPVRSP